MLERVTPFLAFGRVLDIVLARENRLRMEHTGGGTARGLGHSQRYSAAGATGVVTALHRFQMAGFGLEMIFWSANYSLNIRISRGLLSKAFRYMKI